MSCHRYERWFSAYLDGELAESMHAKIEAHLATCPACWAALSAQAETREMLVSMSAPEHSPAYWQAFEADLRAKRAGRRPARARTWQLAWRSVCSLLILFVLSLGIASGSASPSKADILSNIPGATVYLDGQVVGITPLHLTLAAGSHQVALHKEGFRVWEEVVMALASTPLRLEVKLTSLNSQPDAHREGLQQFAYPVMAPDGQTVAFLGSKEDFHIGTGELWLAQLSRGQVQKIRSGLAVVPPSWSADGKRLAYVLSGATGDTLAVWDQDRNVTLTASPELALTQVAWLGKDKIIYLSGSDAHLTQWDVLSGRSLALLSSPVERFALSPDGKWIAYLSASDGNVYLLSLETGVNGVIGPHPEECYALAWSPTGKALALATHDGISLLDLASETESMVSPVAATDLLWLKEGSLLFLEKDGQALWRWDPDGDGPYLLANEIGRMGDLSLCPDGSTFLYSSDAAGFRRLERGDLSGPTFVSAPYLSGSRLALSSQPQAAEVYLNGEYLGRTPTTLSLTEAGTMILTLKKEKFQDWTLGLALADGETREVKATLLGSDFPYQPLSSLDGEKRDAVFSPDGKWLALVCGEITNPQLWLIDMDNRKATSLGAGRHPAWSQDGRSLYFDRGLSTSDIWVYPVTGGEAIQLTISGAAQNPQPSPGGGWVAYLQGLNPAHLELWLMNADGRDARLLAQDEGGQVFALTWSPDGEEILYLEHHGGIDEARLVGLQGTERTLVTGVDLSLPVWSPDGDFLVLQVGTNGKSELRFFRYPELQFYASQSIGMEKTALSWSTSALRWFQENTGAVQATRYIPSQGIPQEEKRVDDAHYLAFTSSRGILIAADWNGGSQVYLVPLAAQTP